MAGPPLQQSIGNEAAASSHAPTTIKTSAGASYPSSLEPLTKNELSLLEMYAVIENYEREAARLKAEEAKRRLEEADERYRAKVKEREREEGNSDNEEDEDGNDAKDEGDKKSIAKRSKEEDDGDDFDDQNKSPQYAESDEEDEETKEARRKNEQKISQLRKNVTAARDAQNKKEAEKEAAKEKEEAMRRELLGEGGGNDEGMAAAGGSTKRRRDIGDVYGGNSDVEDESDADDYNDFAASNQLNSMSGPSIKKKRTETSYSAFDEPTGPSLIANISGGATPVHDFSKKLGMSKSSLDGSVLFPDDRSDQTGPWNPPQKPENFLDGCLELELFDFDPSFQSNGNNTLAIKFHAPNESSRFSINIATSNNDDYNNILFHFNPRHFQKGGQLVINDRNESMWGNAINVPLSTMPLMFGKQSCTLVVQIMEEGFDVFVEGKHCARLEHRNELFRGHASKSFGRKESLWLQFPSSDDYGSPENWMVYRVWWGRKASMAGDLNGVAGVNIYSAVHPRKLFISGLPKLRSDPEVDLRRAELERAFRKYGGPSGAVSVSVQKHSTFAFVELASEQQADLALLEMANRYRINKARRTKHEALMEERAAKDAMEKGTTKDSVDWD